MSSRARCPSAPRSSCTASSYATACSTRRRRTRGARPCATRARRKRCRHEDLRIAARREGQDLVLAVRPRARQGRHAVEVARRAEDAAGALAPRRRRRRRRARGPATVQLPCVRHAARYRDRAARGSIPRGRAGGMSRYDTNGIGERLREVRRSRGFTIGRLAAASGVPASTISKIEKGRLRPSLVNAINLAGALEQNIGFLVSRYRHPPEARVVVRAKKRETLGYGPMGLALQDLNGHSTPGTLEARMGILSAGA